MRSFSLVGKMAMARHFKSKPMTVYGSWIALFAGDVLSLDAIKQRTLYSNTEQHVDVQNCICLHQNKYPSDFVY